MLYPGCSDRNKEVQMITTAGCAPDTSGLIGLAKEAGFTHAAALDMDALEFREDVRAMCRSDRCNNYGKSWSCPPATGSTERAKERISGYHRGIIVQTCGEISGSFDLDAGLLGENMMLAAQSLGLGTCIQTGPVRFLTTNEKAKAFMNSLDIPEGYKLLYVIAVGYPDEAPDAKPRDASKIKYIK